MVTMEFGYAGGLTRQLVWAAAGIAAIEIPVAHLLLSRLHVAVAWGVTAASLAFVAWLLADWWAARWRPILLTDDAVVIPRGLRRVTTAAWGEVTGARAVASSDGLDGRARRTLYGAEATVVIETVGGDLAVSADEPHALVSAVRAAIAASSPREA